jgi:hypothetical protein
MRQVIALVGCLSLFLQGCTSMQAVPVPQGGSGTAAVQAGDSVEAPTRAGEEEHQDEKKSRTVWWILGGAVLAALLAGAGGSGGSSY